MSTAAFFSAGDVVSLAFLELGGGGVPCDLDTDGGVSSRFLDEGGVSAAAAFFSAGGGGVSLAFLALGGGVVPCDLDPEQGGLSGSSLGVLGGSVSRPLLGVGGVSCAALLPEGGGASCGFPVVGGVSSSAARSSAFFFLALDLVWRK